jgi:hypothetical protein
VRRILALGGTKSAAPRQGNACRLGSAPLDAAVYEPGTASRTAIVIRHRAHRRPWLSVKSTSQTHVVRPRWRARASAWTRPSVIGRRKLVWLLRPIAARPSSATAKWVAIEASDSAIDANTPPWTRPAGCLSSSRTPTEPRTRPSSQAVTSSPYRPSKPSVSLKGSRGVATGRDDSLRAP